MYIDVQEFKNKIYLTQVIDGVTSYHVVDDFKPNMYVECNDDAETKSMYLAFPYGKPLESLDFDDIKEFKDYNYKNKDFKESFYGNINAEYQYIAKHYDKKDTCETRTWFMDIETNVEDEFPDASKAEQPITFMQVYDKLDNEIKMFHWQLDYSKKIKPGTESMKYDSEKEMIDGFLEYYYKQKPHMVAGWNFVGFDLRYITNRLRKLGYKDGMLSPFGKTIKKKYTTFNGDVDVEYPIGVVWVSYDDIFYQHAFIKTPDKKLDTASQVVLGGEEGKLDWKRYFKSFKKMAHFEYSPPDLLTDEMKETEVHKKWLYREEILKEIEKRKNSRD